MKWEKKYTYTPRNIENKEIHHTVESPMVQGPPQTVQAQNQEKLWSHEGKWLPSIRNGVIPPNCVTSQNSSKVLTGNWGRSTALPKCCLQDKTHFLIHCAAQIIP